jgi:hypothetical protein
MLFYNFSKPEVNASQNELPLESVSEFHKDPHSLSTSLFYNSEKQTETD